MSTWFTRRVLDSVSALTGIYHTARYGVIARHLERSIVEVDRRRGFIIIQIDGLAYDHLLQAVDMGYMPYLARLLAERRFTVSAWRCGLPTTTPAVQAGILYGNRFDIPGFRWYEKDRGQVISVKRPDQAQMVRARISQGRTGLLRGGSCYVSMFDGDADLALFTLSALNRQRFFESARGLGLLLLFLLSPFRILRLAGITITSLLAGMGRRLVARTHPDSLTLFDVLSPLLHAVSDALLSEAQTFGVLMDIYRCAPAIYTNYTSYDEVAHRLGANHPAAFRVLHAVDKRIRQIHQMCHRYRRREYDIYVISDHGNSPATPFNQWNGVSLGEYIAARVGGGISFDEEMEMDVPSRTKRGYLLDELDGLGDSLSPRLGRILTPARRYVRRRVEAERWVDYDPERRQDIIVSVSGPLAHVYFNASPHPLELSEVLLLYPRLVESLLATPGIGLLAGRSGNEIVLLGKAGGSAIIGETLETPIPPHPLAPYGEVEYWSAQLHQLAHFPHAGDLIVLGEIKPGGEVISFERQAATHGGIGGVQGDPFIIWPVESPVSPVNLYDAQDLYHYFVQCYPVRSKSQSGDGIG